MSVRRARKRNAVLHAVENLWPNGPPDEVRPFDMAKRIRQWLSDYCRREGFPQLSIAYETISAAVKKKRASCKRLTG